MAARDLGLPRWASALIAWLPFVLPAITILAAVLHRPTFDMLTGEDQVGEWLQVAAWAIALGFVVSIVAALAKTEARTLAILYGALALAILFIVGEEVSWGQRIIGFGTPEALEEANRQGEANLHNIYGVQTLFSWGMFAVGAYGTFAPIWALRKWGSYGRWPKVARAVIPHWVLLPYFLLMLVWRTYRNLFEPIESLYVGISEFGEITELVLAVAFAVFAWLQWRSLVRRSRGGGRAGDL